MSEFGALYDTANVILDVVRDRFAASGDPAAVPPVDPAELPARQYVVPGITAAYDCEQLTVTVLQVAIGVPGATINVPITNCAPQRYATYRVELVRDVPSVDNQGNPPSATKLDNAAQETLRDMALLHDAIVHGRERIATSNPDDPLGGVGVPVAVSNATPVGSDGGVAGSRVDVDVPF